MSIVSPCRLELQKVFQEVYRYLIQLLRYVPMDQHTVSRGFGDDGVERLFGMFAQWRFQLDLRLIILAITDKTTNLKRPDTQDSRNSS